jgi:hypothetical protein
VSGTEQALAQRTKFGVSAGLVRSFVYPQGFSTKGRNDFVHAEGRLGYMLGLNAELPLESKTALNADLRFLRTDTFYDVVAVVPTSFQVAYTWQAERFSYRLSVGLSRVLLERGDKQFRVFGGFLAGVERQRLQFDNAAVSFYDGPVSNLSVAFDYTAPNPTVWSAGPEAGVGLRLYKGVDFNLRYNYNFTPTAPIRYASTLTYNGPAGSPRQTTGTVKGRPVFAAAELVVWFR